MRPVVLLPGIGGSILVNKERPTRKVLHKELVHNRWLNVYPYIPKSMDEWKYDMGCKVLRSADGRRVIGLEPLNKNIDVYEMGGTQGMKDLLPEFAFLTKRMRDAMHDMFAVRYFHDMCEMLYAEGYQDFVNLFGVPYDFRLVLDPMYRLCYFWTLQNIIERTGQPCVIFAHSLGAILFKWFVSTMVTREWIDANIAEAIIVSPPFAGSAAALKTIMFGDFYVSYFHKLYKDELQVNSGIVMCMPNAHGFDASRVLLTAGRTDVRRTDYDRLADEGHVSFEIWRDLYAPHIADITAPVTMRTTVFNSVDRDTAMRFCTRDFDTYPQCTEYAPGDGVIVPQPGEWYTRVFGRQTTDVRFVPANHTDIISNAEVLQKVREAALNHRNQFKTKYA